MQQGRFEGRQLQWMIFSNALIQVFDLRLECLPDGLVTGLLLIIEVGGEDI